MGHYITNTSGQDHSVPSIANDPRRARKTTADLARLISRINNVAFEVSAVLDQVIRQHEDREALARKLGGVAL